MVVQIWFVFCIPLAEISILHLKLTSSLSISVYDITRKAGADSVERGDVELVPSPAPQVRQDMFWCAGFHLQLLPVAVLTLVVYHVSWIWREFCWIFFGGGLSQSFRQSLGDKRFVKFHHGVWSGLRIPMTEVSFDVTPASYQKSESKGFISLKSLGPLWKILKVHMIRLAN